MDLNVLTLRHPITLLRLAFRKLIRIASERWFFRSRTGSPLTPAPPENLIDVRALVQQTPLEELNRSAEAFFHDLTDWNQQLAKPFSSVSDTPGLLINFAIALQ